MQKQIIILLVLMVFGLNLPALAQTNDQVAKEQLIKFIETPDEKKGSASFAVKGWQYRRPFVILLVRLGLLSHQGLEPERMNTRSNAVRGAVAVEQGKRADGTEVMARAVQQLQ